MAVKQQMDENVMKGETASILIVEDESIVAMEIEKSLQQLGYSVCSVVGNGIDAVEAARTGRPDMILMDINLTGDMDGIEAAGHIREQFDLPVIYLTAYSDASTTERAKFTRPLGYIQKPFQLSELRVALEMALFTARIDTDRKQAIVDLERESRINSVLADIAARLISHSKGMEAFAGLILNYSLELTGSSQGCTAIMDGQIGNPSVTVPSAGLDERQTQLLLERASRESDVSFPSSVSENHAANPPTSFFDNQPDRCHFESTPPEGPIVVQNFLSVPVFLENRLAGQIMLANSEEGYADADLKSVEQIGELFALAIHRHRSVVERDLMQEQMGQMQKMEAIGTLAGGIAHDFNNILQPIMGYANMALKGVEESDKIHRSLSAILSASARAKDLVQQILTFARKSEFTVQPVEMRLITKEVVKLMRSSLPATIEVKQRIDGESGMVMADPTKIHQILMNLFTNAFHAMQEKGGILDISLKPFVLTGENRQITHLIPGEYVCLSVADTGEGMKPNVMDKIFDPYFTTKEQSKGTGLGLSVVLGIIKGYDGTINVSSEPGKGTEFTVYLPKIVVKDQEPAVTSDPVKITGSENILLVDDEVDIVELEKGMLQELGYHVTTSSSSLEAFKTFSSDPEKIDLVITDMTMPNMTGAELAKRLLRIRPDLPIIICTGFSELINEEKAEAMGIKKYLMKPVSQDQLGKSIRDLLDSIQHQEPFKTTTEQ